MQFDPIWMMTTLLTLRQTARIMEQEALRPLSVGVKGLREVERRAGHAMRRVEETASTVTEKIAERGRELLQKGLLERRKKEEEED